VLVSVGEATGVEDVVKVMAVGRGELELNEVDGVAVAKTIDDKADSVACLTTNRAPSTTAGLMNVILPERM
jgi:hypothetical protein